MKDPSLTQSQTTTPLTKKTRRLCLSSQDLDLISLSQTTSPIGMYQVVRLRQKSPHLLLSSSTGRLLQSAVMTSQ